jgi:hypothetical protein
MSDDLWHRPLSQVRAGELRGDTGQTPRAQHPGGDRG